MIKQLYRFLSPKFKNLFLEYATDFKPRYGHGKPAHPELLNIIEAHRSTYENLLRQALTFKEQIWSIQQTAADASQPHWNNGFLPGLDMVAIYSMLAIYKPKKYIEIGSGNSTKVAYKAKQEQQLDLEIISIDPMPRAEIDRLADVVIRKPIEDTNFDVIGQLNAGDVLFIDNSHRILPNSDSMVFFMEMLPRLKSGVIVHIHDVYLPYDYPQFMCDRFYTEQYGLAMYLLANPKKYETILPNYFISEDEQLSKLIAPMWEHENLKDVERHGGSYWLVVN